MQHHFFCLLALLLLHLSLVGCGGRSRHIVVPGTEGSLQGLSFDPPDHSRHVDTDIDPAIYWVSGAPPSQFTVALRRIDEFGDFHPVPTELKRDGTAYRWRLKVVGNLDEGNLYAIVVYSGNEYREAWFLTRKSRMGRTSPSGRESESRGSYEHTVISLSSSSPW